VSDFPAQSVAPVGATVIATWNLGCLAYNATIISSSAFTSQAWSVSNRAMYAAVQVPRPLTAYEMVWYNGASLSGTVDAGIYDANLNLLVSTGPQTQTGTSNLQTHNITDTAIRPGTYYLGLVQDNTSGTTFRTATNLNVLRASGCGWSAVSAGTLATGPTLSVGSGSELRAVGFVARPSPVI
jgi:hypothetical protein